MKILGTKWFCGRTNVGIVRVLHEYDGIRYYIASIEGFSKAEDAEFIASWGSYFPNEAGDILFGVDPVKNGDAVPVPQNKEQAECMVKIGMHYLGIEL